jgi:hypothetical protein
MSVYRDTADSVVFEHPIEGPLTATIYRDDVVLSTTPTVDKDEVTGQFVVPLNWTATATDGTLTVVWTTQGFERTQQIEVITPIVPLSRLRTLFADQNLGDGDLKDLEATVRVVIEAYTGQKFGYYGSYARAFAGSGSERIALDRRISKLNTVNGVAPDGVKIGADSYSLLVSRDFTAIQSAGVVEVNGVIRLPDWYVKTFRKDLSFVVDGEWGYLNVPGDVQEAALLLASDYLTGDAGYRDRYLYILKIQQDSFTYHPGAFRGTGNARADLLLSSYRRKTGMTIL